MRRCDSNRYPKGLSRAKVLELIKYYEDQSDEDAVAEARAAYRRRTTALIEVPVKLLPQVRRLVAKPA
jgi:hypothetical protein